MGRSQCVSVVIPVRNCAQYVIEAVESALNQHEAAEVIVVDDGSQDETAALVQSIRDRRIRFVPQGPLGAAAARNHGAKLASADFISFLDADDYWLPGKLTAQLEALSAEHAEIVFTGVEEFVSPELSAEDAAALRPRPGVLLGVSVVTLLMRRADFARVGRFREDIRTGEFLDWYARAQEAGFTSLTLSQAYTRRRLHLANHGRQAGTNRTEYASVLRDMLHRRRQATLP